MENNKTAVKQRGYNQSAVFKIIAASIFAALVFVVTSQIPPIPIPATSGYFNIGETTIYIAALIFGSSVGAMAGGIGSSLSDAFLGYGLFAPGTLLIKGGEGVDYFRRRSFVQGHALRIAADRRKGQQR